MVRAAFMLSALLVGSSAFACAMPHREAVSLTQAMDDIDAPAKAPAPTPQPTVIPEVAAAPTPSPSSLWSTVTTTIAEAVMPDVAAPKGVSTPPPTSQAK